MTDGVWRDEERLPLDELNQAMATYSHDGQVDDATGGDASAERDLGAGAFVSDDAAGPRPSPDGPSSTGRTGPV